MNLACSLFNSNTWVFKPQFGNGVFPLQVMHDEELKYECTYFY